MFLQRASRYDTYKVLGPAGYQSLNVLDGGRRSLCEEMARSCISIFFLAILLRNFVRIAHARMHKSTKAQKHKSTKAQKHAHVYAHMHACARARTRTHARMRVHARKHTGIDGDNKLYMRCAHTWRRAQSSPFGMCQPSHHQGPSVSARKHDASVRACVHACMCACACAHPHRWCTAAHQTCTGCNETSASSL